MPDQITVQDLANMTDKEIAIHAAGGYGPRKRQQLMFAIRRALAAAKFESRPTDGPRAA